MAFTFYCGQIYGIEKFFYIDINSNLVTKFPIFLEMEKNLLDINSSHWIRETNSGNKWVNMSNKKFVTVTDVLNSMVGVILSPVTNFNYAVT